jgi:hypothetical protein
VVVPLALGDLPAAPPDFALESLPDRPDGTHAVRVRFTPHAAGVVRTVLDLGAAGGTLPATAVAYAGVMAFPAEVRQQRPTGAAGLPTVTVVVRGAEPITIGRIDYPAGIAGDLRTVVSGKQFRLLLRGRAPASAGEQAIRFHRDGASEPFLVVPVVDLAPGDAPRPRA